MLIVAIPPFDRLSGETGAALLIVAPMIAGQALLDLFLAATRWKHRMRYEVVSRSIVEPYAAMATAAAAWFAGFEETGLLISYWAGTLLALAYAIWGTHLSFGSLALRTWRLDRGRTRSILRAGAVPMANDLVSGLFARLDLYLVGLFLGESPAGIYGMARQVRTPIRQVRQSLRRTADPDRRQDARRQRPARKPEPPGFGGAPDPRHPARHPGHTRGHRPAAAELARAGVRARLLRRCFCSPPRRRSRARSASPT